MKNMNLLTNLCMDYGLMDEERTVFKNGGPSEGIRTSEQANKKPDTRKRLLTLKEVLEHQKKAREKANSVDRKNPVYQEWSKVFPDIKINNWGLRSLENIPSRLRPLVLEVVKKVIPSAESITMINLSGTLIEVQGTNLVVKGASNIQSIFIQASGKIVVVDSSPGYIKNVNNLFVGTQYKPIKQQYIESVSRVHLQHGTYNTNDRAGNSLRLRDKNRQPPE